MKFLKNIGGRALYLVVGIILTILGAYLIYFDFANSGKNSYSGGITTFSIAMFIIGLASVGVAFSKKKPDNKQPDKPV